MGNLNISKSGKSGGLFLTLFSIPFAGVGTVMGALIIWTLAVYFDQQNWDTAEAFIKSAKLESHTSDNSTSYSVKATYDYKYKGKTYHNATKVSQYSGSDNISDFHQKLYRKLKKHLKNKERYQCFVNPEDPLESVLNRDLRPFKLFFFAIFAVVFGGAGFSLMIWGIKTTIASKKIKKLKNVFPDQPWYQKEEWREGVIKSSGKAGLIFSIIFALFWNVISLPISVIVLMNEAEKGHPIIYLILLFPLVGVFLMIWAIISILKFRKFGESYFRMDSVPGVIGGKLSGKVCTTVNIVPEDGFNIKLQCVNRYVSGSGKNSSTHERILWEDEKLIEKELLYKDLTRSEIPVLFAIPFSEKETDERNSRNSIIWKLKVSAAVPGLDYSEDFEIPVFKTEASSLDFVIPEEEIKALPMKKVKTEEILDRGGIIISPSYSGGMEYLFPMGRNWKSSLSLTLFAIVWNAVLVGIYLGKGPSLFLIIFGMVGIVLLLCTLNSWLNKYKVVVDKYSIKLSGGFMGIGKTREIDVKEFKEFECRLTSRSNSSTFYKVVMNTISNETYKVASGLKGKILTEAFIAELENQIKRD